MSGMIRPSPGWITATSSSDISRCPDQTVTSFNDFSSAMRRNPPRGGIVDGCGWAQASPDRHRADGERERRGLRERDRVAEDRIRRAAITEQLERRAHDAKAGERPARDDAGHRRPRWQERDEREIRGRRVELQRMAR